MNAHVIENNRVVNTIVVTGLNSLPNLIDASAGGGIGWGYVDGVLIPPPSPPESVPMSVTRRQGKLQLLSMGLLDDVNAAISARSPADQITYNDATEFDRSFPLVVDMIETLGWTSEEADQYFIAASKL